MVNQYKQNEIANTYFDAPNLASREESIMVEIIAATGFQPVKLLGRSSFWGSQKIGAFHYAGQFEGKDVVLKVQGIKPNTSEIDMLQSFERVNKSSIIRPPYLYASIPWDDQKGYEALIMEDLKGNKVVSHPASEAEVAYFFEVYREYRKNCLQEPWVGRPEKSITESIQQNFSKWLQASEEIYANHPHRKPEDARIIQEAREILIQGYQGAEPEFQHGHFSADDLYKVEDKIVLLSNLYWSWRMPLYDAVFAYHWYIYRMANAVDGLIPADIETHRAMWLSKIAALPEAQGTNARLLDLALLERETAGLVMDALTVEPTRPIAEYVVSSTRDRIIRLMEKLRS